MDQTVSVIMPAYRAEAQVPHAVRSLLAQEHQDWRLLLVSDDGADYEAVLARAGISDRRITHLSSGGTGLGAAASRNVALKVADTAYMALLDADDLFKPEKLSRSVAALEEYALVSTALELAASDHRPLRNVGVAPDGPLDSRDFKWHNFSGDSTLVWDRRRADADYDPGLRTFADLDFLMRLMAHVERGYHIGQPLYVYVKEANSLSNGAGASTRIIAAKQLLLDRLAADHYRFRDAGCKESIMGFLTTSLAAERSFEAALAARPGLLFEDHLEPMLAAARPATVDSVEMGRGHSSS